MISNLSILLISLFSVALATNKNASCLIINLLDSFGDGWGDAIWLVESPSGEVFYHSPNCTANPAVHRICGEHDGLYYMMVSNDGTPSYSWEIFWTVGIESKELIYTGGFETSMVFEYNSQRNSWAIVYWQKLWSNYQNFTSCGGSDYVESGYCHPSTDSQIDTQSKPTRSPKKSLPSSTSKSREVHHGKHVNNKESRSSSHSSSSGSSSSSPNYIIRTVRITDSSSNTHRSLSGQDAVNKLKKVVSHKPTTKPISIPTKKSKADKITSTATSEHMGGGIGGSAHKVDHSKTIAKVVSSVSLSTSDSKSPDLTSSSSSGSAVNNPVELPDSHEEDSQEIRSWTDLKVTMYSSGAQGWFKPDYRGTMFYISDESKTVLVAYGSLENGTYSGYCEYCFRDGSYTFRVTNSKGDTSEKSWSFCNTNGTTSEQLSFHIENGYCVPDALFDVSLVCSKTSYSVVTVTGRLALYGVTSEIFSEEDEWALIHSLSSSVFGWNPEFIDIDSIVSNIHYLDSTLSQNTDISTTTRTSGSSGHRTLSSFVIDVTFSVSFVAEMTYDVDGTNRRAVESLVYGFERTLNDAMNSGDFTSLMRGLASSVHSGALHNSRQAELISLEIADITFVGSLPMTLTEEIDLAEGGQSELIFYDDNSDLSTQTIIMNNSIFLMTLCVVGLLSLVGIGSIPYLIKLSNTSREVSTEGGETTSRQEDQETESEHDRKVMAVREMDLSNHFKVMRIIKERMSTKL